MIRTVLISTLTTAALAGSLAASCVAKPAHQGFDAETKSQAVLPYQKPGIPLRMTHAEIKPIEAGDVTPVRVSFPDVPKGATVLVTLNGTMGLDIQGPTTLTLPFTGSIPELVVNVSSKLEGRHYLNVHSAIDGVAGKRVMSVPVQVGQGGVVNKIVPGDLVEGADGTPIMAMQASETINGEPVENK